MERYRIASNFNGNLSQRPTFPTTTSSSISLPPKPHLREPPITPFTPKQPTNPKDMLGRRADDTEISIFDAERYFNGGKDPQDDTKRTTLILEGVVERCDLSTNPRDSSVSSVDGYGKYRNGSSFHATPTASSEASWNSQSGLLTNPPGSIALGVRAFPLHEQRRGAGRRLFRRNCPCSGKKSVDVEEKYSEPKSPIRSSYDLNGSLGSKLEPPKSPILPNHINGFLGANKQNLRAVEEEKERVLDIEEVRKVKIVAGSWTKDEEVVHGSGRFSPEKTFPAEIGHRIVNSGRPFNDGSGFSFPVLAPAADPPEEPPRESLEVFRPAEELAVMRKSADFQRRAPAVHFAGDGDRRRPVDDDVASDTSSDLFEIESFSTQMTYRRHDSLDELSQGSGSFEPRRFTGSSTAGFVQFRSSLEDSAGAATPSIAPSECYPPSEVSVEWSVTTAEGFDRASVANFSSAASEVDELRFIQVEHDRFAASVAGVAKRRGTGLLSCVCEKAVSVGPNPVRFVPDLSRPSIGAFVVEPDRVSGVARLSSRIGLRDRTGVARSHSARMSRPVQTR